MDVIVQEQWEKVSHSNSDKNFPECIMNTNYYARREYLFPGMCSILIMEMVIYIILRLN